MENQFFINNRKKFYEEMAADSVFLLFSGKEIIKTNDEFYPFFADRSFVYLTGITQKESILLAWKDPDGNVQESLYLLPSDFLLERWTGRRLTGQQAADISGITEIHPLDHFEKDFHRLITGNEFSYIYLDLFRTIPGSLDRPAQNMRDFVIREYPYLQFKNANMILRKLRLVKQDCEIEALREAEKITGDAITSMMKASKPGMYEYQYKAVFDYVLQQYGPQGPGFPSIISAGKNNFCIHYYSYTGQAKDGDMVLNDVGAQYDNLITDVSRGWPCNGKFTEKQKLLFECALHTSNHMFEIIRPGMKMMDVDATIRSYNANLLKDAGVLKDVKEIGTYMWHGGAHHIGYDVHDVVKTPELVAPGHVFCIDVGIYHEEWGIGFRLEDNCLVTENGCENLSAAIPRTVYDIEQCMKKDLF